MLDSDGKISPAQILSKLKKLGLIAPRRKIGDADEPFPTSTKQSEGEGTAGVTILHKSLNSKGNMLGQHL